MPRQKTDAKSRATGTDRGSMRTRGKGKPRNGLGTTRRDEIMEVAGRLFARNGFEATSVREIASEVDILSGSLYHHFATKEDILHEILRKAPPISRKSIDISNAREDTESKLAALLILRFRELTRDRTVFGIIYNNRNFFRSREEFGYVEEEKRRGFEVMEGVLQKGVDEGLFKKDLDVHLTIGTVFRLLSGGADWYISGRFVRGGGDPTDYDLDTLIDYHLDFILSAIRSPDRVRAPIPREAAQRLLDSVEARYGD